MGVPALGCIAEHRMRTGKYELGNLPSSSHPLKPASISLALASRPHALSSSLRIAQVASLSIPPPPFSHAGGETCR